MSHGSNKSFPPANAQFAAHFEAFESEGHCFAVYSALGFLGATGYSINKGVYKTCEGELIALCVHEEARSWRLLTRQNSYPRSISP